jgi:hypothetical protein
MHYHSGLDITLTMGLLKMQRNQTAKKDLLHKVA